MSVIWSGVTEEGAVVPVQVTAEGKVVAVGDGPEGEYLKLTGGNLTGDLTLGDPSSPNISLNAGDGSTTFAGGGSATFEGAVKSNAYLWANASGPSAGIYNYENGSTNASSYIQQDSSNNTKISFAWDGSATFAGDVDGKTITSTHGLVNRRVSGVITNHIECTTDGSNNFKVDPSGVVGIGSSSQIVLNSDGSATFASGKCGFTSAGELIFTSRNTRYKLVVSDGFLFPEPYTRQMEIQEKAEQFIADKRETKPSDPQAEVTPDNDNA